MKVVLDTNIFVSGTFWKSSLSRQILDSWDNDKFTLVSSNEMIAELVRILRDFKVRMADDEIELIKENIFSKAIIVEPLERVQIVKDDPDDDKFFEAAIAGGVGWIVSQDRHLLKVRVYRGVNVVTPEEFMYLLV